MYGPNGFGKQDGIPIRVRHENRALTPNSHLEIAQNRYFSLHDDARDFGEILNSELDHEAIAPWPVLLGLGRLLNKQDFGSPCPKVGDSASVRGFLATNRQVQHAVVELKRPLDVSYVQNHVRKIAAGHCPSAGAKGFAMSVDIPSQVFCDFLVPRRRNRRPSGPRSKKVLLKRIVLAAALLACMVLSAPAQVERSEQQELPVVPSKRWALVVGAKDYEFYSPLKYTTNDAKGFADALVQQFRFEKDSVKVLTDDGAPRDTPTTGHIIGELRSQLADKRLNKSDLFIFFFAGHGVGTSNGDYLLPTDARPESVQDVGLPVKKVIDMLVEAGMKNVLIIADACRSGEENQFGTELTALADKANMAVLLGCAPGRRSYEYGPLRHGSFTYHLLRALKNPDMRDASSGALWASKVGETVEKEVFDYTERDYGAAAQRPVTWSDKTRDVLLGAFPPRAGLSDGDIAFFREQAKTLNKNQYASALIAYAEALFDIDKYDACVEVLKTVESLEELTPGARYTLGVALKLMDRTGEAARVLTALSNDPDASYYRELAIVTNPTRGLTDAAKVAAAKELWALDKSWDTGFLVWVIYQQMAPESLRLAFLKEFAAQESLTDRQRLFLEGCILAAQLSFDPAIEAISKAISADGSQPGDQFLRLVLVPMLELQGRTKELEALTEEALKGPDAAYWWIIRARIQKDAKDWHGLVASLGKVLSANPDAEQLLEVLHLGSFRAFQLAEEIQAVAKTMPYSWKAQLAAAISDIARVYESKPKDEFQQAIAEAVDKAGQYADDEIRFMVEAFSIMDDLLVGLMEEEAVEPLRVSVIQGFYFSLMLSQADQFGDYDDAWFQLLYFGLSHERTLQLNRIFHNRFDSKLQPGALSGTLRMYILQTALCAGDDATIEKIFAQGGLLPTDQIDSRWMHATYLACRGRFKEAEAVLKDLPEPTLVFRTQALALRAWLEARAGKKSEALAKLAKLTPDDLHLSALMGLAYEALGDWKNAEPLLSGSRSRRNWGQTFVHAAAVQALFKHALANKDATLADELAYESAISQPDNPMFADIHYGLKPDVSATAGTYRFHVLMQSDEPDPATNNTTFLQSTGKLTLTVEKSGKVSGVYEDAKAQIRSISGTVDKFNNVQGTVRGEGEELALVGKLAPLDRFGTNQRLRDIGQLFMLYGKERRTTWVSQLEPDKR